MRRNSKMLSRFSLLGLLGLPSLLGPLVFIQGCAPNDTLPTAAGMFEATEVIVSSETTGRLLQFSINEGDTISAGSAIGKVDCSQLELQREQLVTRMGNLETKIVDINTQVAPIKQQIAETERERKRLERLITSGAAPSKQLDNVTAQIAVLRSQEAATVPSLTMNNAVIADEQNTMQLQLAQIDDQIDRCELKSPTSGTVLVKYAQEGEFTAPGKALFKIGDTKKMFLRAYVTADQLTQMQLGQSVKVAADFGAQESRTYDGKITWVATKSEFTPKTIQTRDERANQVYAIKVAVENDGFLKIGMYGYITKPAAPDTPDAIDTQTPTEKQTQTQTQTQTQSEPQHAGNSSTEHN